MTTLNHLHPKYHETKAKSMLLKAQRKEQEAAIVSLGKRIAVLVGNGASLRELARLIAQDGRFSCYLVKLAGCGQVRDLDEETITHALLLIGTDRLQEIVSDIETLRRVVRH